MTRNSNGNGLQGMYISPLLRWTEEKAQHSMFEEWIDWDWQSWLEETYEYTRSTIIEGMKEKYLAWLWRGQEKLASQKCPPIIGLVAVATCRNREFQSQLLMDGGEAGLIPHSMFPNLYPTSDIPFSVVTSAMPVGTSRHVRLILV